MIPQPISQIFGLGQPLIDYHTKDNEVEIAFGDVTLNTILGVQKSLSHLIKSHIEAIYTGMVGKDGPKKWEEFTPGKKLNAQLLVAKEGETGKVVCTRINSTDSMTVHPGVSKQIKFEQVKEKCGKLIKENALVLLPGFTLEFQDKFAEKAVKYFTKKKGFISCNIGATWIIDKNRDRLLKLLNRVHHVCCNLEEAKTLVNNPALNDTPEMLVAEIKKMAPQAVVVVTGGENGSWGCSKEGEVVKGEPANLKKSKIVNTIGAGDNHQAFFLAALLSGHPLDRSLIYANAAAAKVLKVSQGQFPQDAWEKFQRVRP